MKKEFKECPNCGNDNCSNNKACINCNTEFEVDESTQRLSAVQLAEMDRIKNDVYAIINQGERGLLITDFEAAKEVCEKIAEYMMKDNSTNY